MSTAGEIAHWLDIELGGMTTADYANALNGLQVDHRGPVRKIAAAVDCSTRTIRLAAEEGANLLIVHHGMFWGGIQPIRHSMYERLTLLFSHDIAVYASHLPLDRHPELGNNALLARALGLSPDGEFARVKGVAIGVQGPGSLETATIVERARKYALQFGSTIQTAAMSDGRVTQRWAICTGSGASSDTLIEAHEAGVDTLIVGEGPHHTAVEAEELNICVLYLGHYATETLGVQALARHASKQFDRPWVFVHAPTGL